MNQFIFDNYVFDGTEAKFFYRDHLQTYCETFIFKLEGAYDKVLLDRALYLMFLLVGVSYYKAYPTRNATIRLGDIDAWQADFLNKVYTEGLGQFAYDNNLTRDDLAAFQASTVEKVEPLEYTGEGIITLQSGGKDSLLLAELLERGGESYTPWYMATGVSHPAVLDKLSSPLVVTQRVIDRTALSRAESRGGLNGHVPVTFIALAAALVQTILLGKNTVLAAIGHEGEEPHAYIGEMPVTHQWSKTWRAEQLLAEYVHRYISPDIRIGSPLRGYSELKITNLFTKYAWGRFGNEFSSCNRANYQQDSDNTQLVWCGSCSKCANSFILFAAWLNPDQLEPIFRDNLFRVAYLQNDFKGLLGVEGVMKPFECVGEVDELRYAYQLALHRGYEPLPFTVPASYYDFDALYEHQLWARKMINEGLGK